MLATSIAIGLSAAALATLIPALTIGPRHIVRPPDRLKSATWLPALFIAVMLAALGHYARSQALDPFYLGSPSIKSALVLSGALFLLLGGAMVGGIIYVQAIGKTPPTPRTRQR